MSNPIEEAAPSTESPDGGRGRRARRSELLVPIVLMLLSFWAYRASPNRELLDSKYALLTSEALLSHGSFDLRSYFPGLDAQLAADPADRADRAAPANHTDAARVDLDVPYQLRLVDGRLVNYYPIGTSLLSLPFYAVHRLLGDSTLDPNGSYGVKRELRLQAWLAALLAGSAVGLGFLLARRELPLGPAVVVALGAAFSSGLWSVASRVLWNHTWTIVLLAAALVELLRWEDGEARRPVLLGALLVASFWVRPTNAFSAIAFVLYVAFRHRAALLRLAVTGAIGFASYVILSLTAFSSWLPRYVVRHVVPHGQLDPLRAFVGQLISTEHGLLVYSPILLVVAWQLLRCGVARERRGVAALCAGMVAWYILYHSFRSRWWGAGAAGPRFLSDLIPYLVWLGAHSWRRARERPLRAAVSRWAAAVATALLLVAGVAAHAKGAFPMQRERIMIRPVDVKRGGRFAPLEIYVRRLPQAQTARWLLDRDSQPETKRPRALPSARRRGASPGTG